MSVGVLEVRRNESIGPVTKQAESVATLVLAFYGVKSTRHRELHRGGAS